MPPPPRHLCAVLALAAVACRTAAPTAPLVQPPVPVSPSPSPPPLPPRYVALESVWIERASGLDRVLADSRRVELRGLEIARVVPSEAELDGGARVPPWSPPGVAPYRFWRGKHLYAADTFDGPLRKLATLPVEPRGTFDWLGGVGLLLPGGALVAPAAGGAPVPLGVPAVVHAVAADARRALVATALGHTLLTLDAGATWRDVSADLGGAVALEVRGDDLAAVLADGRERIVTANGAISGAAPTAPARGRRPLDEPDGYLGGSLSRALDIAVRTGVPLPDGGIVVAEAGFVGRLDPVTLRTTSLAALDPGLASADCAPLRAADTLLLACADHDRAAVVDLGGAPRTERTFDLAGAPDIDRFVGVDGEALGYLGPCEGPSPRRDDLDAVVTGGVPSNAGRQRTPVFCARAGRDAWVEHRLDPADAADVIAWIPRPGGAAVALVARWGSILPDAERVTVRGALRVVRVARNEPPFAISPYGWEPAAVLARNLRVTPDDTLEGWLTESGNGVGTLAVSIDPRGRPSALPGPPRAATLTTAGRFALAQSDDGKLWETPDGGHTWLPLEPAPGAATGTPVTACSPAGCRIGPYARLGWASGSPPAALPALAPPPPLRVPPAPALLRLACAFDGAPEGKRIADSAGFGYTPAPRPRGTMPVRIGRLGMAMVPYSGSVLPASAEAELAWVTPLDTSAALHRATLPLAHLVTAGPRPGDLRLGWLLTPTGGLTTFALASRAPCTGDLLELPGVTRALGGCAEDPSVAVDLGTRVIVVHPGNDTLVVSASDAPRRPGPTSPAALRELHVTNLGVLLRGFTFGVGARAGAPVLVVVDRSGGASLAPIDPERGTLGAEERLRPLPEAHLGSDPACAPRPGEATIVLPFEDLLALDALAPHTLRGISSASEPGVAVLRWSRDRVCLDAAEIPVSDERFDESRGPTEPHGVLRKIIARFDPRGGKSAATLLLVSSGAEVRQRLQCSTLRAGEGG